jgi:hypothetical protein
MEGLHNFRRPYFISGLNMIQQTDDVAHLKKLTRVGIGNRDMTRNNFISPAIRGRDILNFDALAAQDIATAGIKVQLSDSSLDRLLKISVPDKTDVEWITEYNRKSTKNHTATCVN